MLLQRFSPLIWQYVVLLMLSTAIVLLGCSNSNDNVTSQDVADMTFIFDSSFLDNDLEGLTTCLTFGAPSATDETLVPYTMTLHDADTTQDTITCPGTVVATFSGPASIGSIELRIESITDANGEPVDSINFAAYNSDVTFNVGETITFDVHVNKKDADTTTKFTFTNDRGNELVFEFENDAKRAVASPDN